MITITPIALVRNTIDDVNFNQWADIYSEIRLVSPFDQRFLQNLQDVKLIQLIFHFHRSSKYQLNSSDKDVFLHRRSPRPNNLGVSIVPLIRISGDTLVVEGLDAINGTPVFDIKPFSKDDLP